MVIRYGDGGIFTTLLLLEEEERIVTHHYKGKIKNQAKPDCSQLLIWKHIELLSCIAKVKSKKHQYCYQ